MNYSQLLQGIVSSESEKTASDNSNQASVKSAAETAKESLTATLKQAVQNEKTASAYPSDPVDALIKEAQRLAEDQKTADVIHARNCGRAFGDAAGESWASQHAQQKVASFQPQAQTVNYESQMQKQAEEQGYMDTVTKVAAEQGYIDVMQKVAAEQGYADTMQKVAAEQYDAGQSSALEDVRNAAAEEFMKGAQEVEVLISQNNAQ
jgi:hypothetical protein